LSKIEEAQEILRSLGLPAKQQNERSALTLLVLAQIAPSGSWKNAQQPMLRIWDIMGFMRDHYGKRYAANTRETIRRQTIHQFEQARIVDRNPDDPSRPTNSGKNCYALTRPPAATKNSYTCTNRARVPQDPEKWGAESCTMYTTEQHARTARRSYSLRL
jgi:hypothetical protein